MEQFENIYAKYYQKIYLFLLKLSGDQFLAEELTQETLYRAFLHIDQYEGRSTLYSWLCGIARNNYLAEMKKQRPLVRPDETWEPASGEDLEEDVLRRHMLSALRREILRLREPYMSVCMLRIYGELSYAEIAAEFDRSESWAKVTYFRGKAKLTERMEKYQ